MRSPRNPVRFTSAPVRNCQAAPRVVPQGTPSVGLREPAARQPRLSSALQLHRYRHTGIGLVPSWSPQRKRLRVDRQCQRERVRRSGCFGRVDDDPRARNRTERAARCGSEAVNERGEVACLGEGGQGGVPRRNDRPGRRSRRSGARRHPRNDLCRRSLAADRILVDDPLPLPVGRRVQRRVPRAHLKEDEDLLADDKFRLTEYHLLECSDCSAELFDDDLG